MKKIKLDKLMFWSKDHKEKSLKSDSLDLNKQWKRAFIFFVILVLALVIFEVRIFLRIDQDSIFESVAPKAVEVENINSDEILSVLNYYKEKQSRFESMTSSVDFSGISNSNSDEAEGAEAASSTESSQ